jgi:hypothetical protein
MRSSARCSKPVEIKYFERARFHVHVHGETHTVDLLTNRCNGSCNCWHFLRYYKNEIKEAIDNGSFVPHQRFQCPHIEACRWWMGQRFLEDLAKKYPDNEHEI